MWLHIRGVGEWTNRLHNYFEKEQEKLHNIREELPSVQGKAKTSNASVTPPENKGLKRIQAYVKFLKFITLRGCLIFGQELLCPFLSLRSLQLSFKPYFQ